MQKFLFILTFNFTFLTRVIKKYKILSFVTFLIVYHTGLTFNLYSQPSITWQRSYLGPYLDYGYSIVQTPDNGYIAVGRHLSQIFAMRLNYLGDTIWTRFFSGGWSESIEKTNDGNYIISGYFASLMKININGDSLWGRSSVSTLRTPKVKQTSDNSYIQCGAIDMGSTYKPYLQKVDSLGNLLWSRIYSSGIYDGGFADVVESKEGSYVLCGLYADTIPLYFRLFIMKTDSLGNQKSFRAYDSVGSPTSMVNAVNQDGYIIGGGGSPPPPNGGNAAFLAKFSNSGLFLWRKTYDPGNPYYGTCESVIKTYDGGYAFAGYWDSTGNLVSNVRLIKTDSSGNELWRRSYGFTDNNLGYGLRQTSDSGYVIIGYTDDNQSEQVYIIKTDKTGYANPPIGVIQISNEIPEGFKLYQNYPNPFNSTTVIRYEVVSKSNVKLKIYDPLGRELAVLVNEEKPPGTHYVIWNAEKYSSGVYLVTLITNLFYFTRKMIYLK